MGIRSRSFGPHWAAACSALVVVACSSDQSTDSTDAGVTGNGGSIANGGSAGNNQAGGAKTGNGGAVAGNGGAAAGSGGANPGNGGSNSSGGSSSGGAVGSGGATSSGGSTGTGGCTCTDAGSSPPPVVGGCSIFTADDAWNRDITNDPVDANWTGLLYANAKLKNLHPDFGSGFGIPFNVVPQSQTPLTITFDYADESDPSPYPFPGDTAKIEGGSPTNCGGDCHVLALEQGACLLYEGYACSYTTSSSSWHCGSGAKWDLSKNSYGQRTIGWTSADAAGLAIFPGLVKYAEVAAGAVNHAIRFTMHCTQDGYVRPATHQAVPGGNNGCPAGISQTDLEANYPPMGLRIRLKPSYDASAMGDQAKVVVQAMKTYGMILADNGSDYFFQGDDDSNWDDNQLNALKGIPGDAFEAIVPGAIGR